MQEPIPAANDPDEAWMETLQDAVARNPGEPLPVSKPDFVSQTEFDHVRVCLQKLEQYRRERVERCVEVETANGCIPQPRNESAAVRCIGRFEIVRELGSGAHGIVFLANDPLLERQVALKVLRREALSTPQLRERFLREARAAARISHQNVVRVHEVGHVGPIDYIAAEYCPGVTLADQLALEHRLEPQQAASLLAQLAAGVAAAHSQGVLHRDLKPANVLLVPHESAGASEPCVSWIAKVADFGLAKLDDALEDATRTGVLLGTPAYMAPEQAEGRAADVGAPTDIYGLGAILYEMLVGHAPFKGASEVDSLRRLLDGDPKPPSDLRPQLPRDLEAICLHCLQRQPKHRYATASALLEDLERFLAGKPTRARPLTPAMRLMKWARRRPALASLLGVTLMASAIIFALMTIHIAHLRSANATAEMLRREALASAETSRRQERAASDHLYASRMRLAYQWLDFGELEQVDTLLGYYAAHTPLANLRGFEWFHLKQRMHSERLTLRGHQGEVYAVTFTPDGRQIVSGGEDGTIRFWDAASGQALETLPAHASCVNVLAYSPDGQVLASGSCDATIKLWDAATHQLTETLDADGTKILTLAFCPTDPNCLAAGGSNSTPDNPDSFLKLWDLKNRTVRRTFDVHAATVNSVSWLPDGKALYAAAHRIWKCDPESGRMETQIALGSSAVSATADGHLFFTGHDDIHKMSTQSPGPTMLLRGHARRVDALALSTNGDRIASGSTDGNLRIWDIASNRCLQVFPGHRARVQAVAFSPSDETLASGSFDGTIKLWGDRPADQTMLQAEGTVRIRESSVLVALSSDLKYAAMLTGLEEASVYSLADSSLLGQVPLAGATLNLQFLPDSPLLFGLPIHASSVDVWDVEAWKSTATYPLPDDAIDMLAMSDENLIIGTPQRVDLVHPATGRVLQQRPRSSGPFIPTDSVDGPTTVIEVNVGGEGWIIGPSRGGPPLTNATKALSLDGRLAGNLAGSYRDAQIIDRVSGRVVSTLRHRAEVRRLAVSPDARTVATVCAHDSQVYLWNVATGQEIARWEVPGVPCKVQFSADGRRLAIVSTTNATNESAGQFADGATAHHVRATIHVTVWSGIDGP